MLYHLTEAGWTDVVLVERKELTAGSTWHSAGGMHTLNGDPNVAKLQQYTIELYQHDRGPLRAGLLDPPARRADAGRRPGAPRLAAHGPGPRALPRHGARDHHRRRGQGDVPAARGAVLRRRLFDPVEGHVDPSGVTNAYAICARQAGAEVYRHTWVNDLRQRPDGTWDVITDQGEIHAEHIVNAGGLWAREVGRMIGLELPVLGMEHMYLVTEDMDGGRRTTPRTGHEMPMALDFDGEIYIRQEQGGMLLGTYEQACVPWSPQEAPWSFDMELLATRPRPHRPSLEIAFKHYPAMATAASSGSSTGRSRSPPTATRSSARSAACATAGSPAP